MLVWNEYSANVSGATYKFVECEECKQKYVYRMVRTGAGQGNSLYFLDNAGAQRRAQGQAKAELEHKLKKECDAVPCPKCGLYQEDMVEKMRKEYRMWLYYTGVFVIFSAFLAAALGIALFGNELKVAGVSMFIVAVLGVVGGAGAIAWRIDQASGFDPNAAPAKERLKIAEQKAQKVKNFEKWLKENGIEFQEPEAT
jgi:hypothetical protein